MKLGRSWTAGPALAAAALLILPGCNRRKPAEVNDIVPSVSVNRPRAPLGSAVEVTYSWKAEPTAKPLSQEYRAFSHFLDSHQVVLFADDHMPEPPTTAWQPGQTYTYTRTVFVPIYPYVGDVEIRTGLHPTGRGERAALKGDDAGMREYRVGKMELLPQTENIFLVYKDGWHNPESSPQNPSLERTWTKKEALVSFKNPKKDVVLYLEADTNAKLVALPQAVTVSVNNNRGVVVPIDSSEVFVRKVRFKAADLGEGEWVDLRLTMNYSFVPKELGLNQDYRELGLMVYHLFVGEADKLGQVQNVVDAGTVMPPPPMPPVTRAGALPAVSPAVSPRAGRSASPGAPRLGSPVPPRSPRPAAPSPAASPSPPA
jgi:hypothetical protein